MKANRYSFLFLIILVLNILVSQIFTNVNNDNYIVSSFLILIDTIVVLYCLTKIKDKNIGALLFISYIVKIIILFFDIFGRTIFVLPNSGADTEMFFHRSMNNYLADDYSKFLHYLYILVGNQRLIFQYVNILFSLLSEFILYKLLKNLKIEENIKSVCMLLYCFMPNHLIISSILLRESLMILLNTISLYYFVNYYYDNIAIFFLLYFL